MLSIKCRNARVNKKIDEKHKMEYYVIDNIEGIDLRGLLGQIKSLYGQDFFLSITSFADMVKYLKFFGIDMIVNNEKHISIKKTNREVFKDHYYMSCTVDENGKIGIKKEEEEKWIL